MDGKPVFFFISWKSRFPDFLSIPENENYYLEDKIRNSGSGSYVWLIAAMFFSSEFRHQLFSHASPQGMPLEILTGNPGIPRKFSIPIPGILIFQDFSRKFSLNFNFFWNSLPRI